MKLSLKWLKDYVDIDVSPKEYSDALTMSGSKVEGYEILGEEIANVVAGKVISIEKHPDADKLFVCQVDIGSKEPVQIVTGANNVNAGDLVSVAKDGSALVGGKKITAGKLRGVVSNGMLCSLSELGLTKNDFPYAVEDGIFIMQEDCSLGQDIKEVLGLDDTVVEFEITSNRPDCLSVIGLARETAAAFNVPLNVKTPVVKEDGGNISDFINATVSEPKLCPRYSARVIKNVKIEPSPKWLRERLRASGVRPINNIVDITNYVMLEYGQPMHAFDYACLNGNHIDVRCAKDNEVMHTLDGQERALDRSLLVIADKNRAVALAGIMGGENSEIKDTTTTIVFESANFESVCVRLGSKKVGLRTESSARFEKGLDANNTVPALERACELIEELKAGEVVKGIIDVDNSDKTQKVLPLEADWINSYLGIQIKKDEMTAILKSLEIQTDEKNNVIIPSFRADIEHKADLAEEIARIYGYNKIPSTMFKGAVTQGRYTKKQMFEKKIKEVLLSQGLSEIYTYSFISPKYYDKINLPQECPLRKSVQISNPLGEDTGIMRTTMLPSMLETLSRNYNLRNESAALFEVGTIYLPDDDEQKLPEEKRTVLIGLYGNDYDFYSLKGIIESLLDSLNISDAEYLPFSKYSAYHPGKTAQIIKNGLVLGTVGEIHPLVLKNYEMDIKTICAVLNIDELSKSIGKDKIYASLPKFPSTARDLALICDDDLPVAKIEKIIKENCGDILEQVKLFDVYKGKQIQEGKKSVAYSLSFRAKDRTLSDSEIDEVMTKLIASLNAKGAVLRS